MPMIATRKEYQAAIDRAAYNGGAQLIAYESRDKLLYRVQSISRPTSTYRVHVRPDRELACECDAGKYNRPCTHAAAVWLRRVAEGIQYQRVTP